MTYFEGGNCIGRFPLATNEVYTNRTTGERVTNTEWHTIVVRNKAAEICEKYLSKGDKVYVEGRLKTRQHKGEDGNTRYTTEIQVTDFTFLSTRKEAQQDTMASSQPIQQPPSGASQSRSTTTEISDEDDDLPF